MEADGGLLSFTLTTLTGCSWTSSSRTSWITILSSRTGNSSVPVTLLVARNDGAERSGEVEIANRIFTVTQDGVAAPPVPPVPPPPAPQPADCVVSEWSLATADAWSACVDGVQTRIETWIRTIVTPPSNGGAVCPVLSEIRTASQACISPEVTLEGAISALAGACPLVSFSVAGQNVTTSASTDYRHGACSDLSIGKQVTVRGIPQNGSVTATRIDFR
jgi:hypothetical protein